MDLLITLLLLAVIVYFSFKSRFVSPKRPEPLAPDEPGPDRAGFDDAAEMHKDPVCGTYVEPNTEYQLIMDGKRYYFCSEECMRKFRSG